MRKLILKILADRRFVGGRRVERNAKHEEGAHASGMQRRLKAAINPGISRQAFPGTAPENGKFPGGNTLTGKKSFHASKVEYPKRKS